MAGPEQQSSLVTQAASEVAPENSHLLEFLVLNARKIGLVAGICIVLAAAYGVYAWHAGKQLAAAQNELGAILITASDTDRLAKLKTFAASAPAKMQDGVQLAIARTALLAKDYPAATAAWNTLTKNVKSPMFIVAVIGKAESLAMEGKEKEALETLKSANLPAGSEGLNLVNSLIVDFAEKTGDFATAIATSEKLVAGVAARGPEEADFWRQKAASLRLVQAAAKKT